MAVGIPVCRSREIRCFPISREDTQAVGRLEMTRVVSSLAGPAQAVTTRCLARLTNTILGTSKMHRLPRLCSCLADFTFWTSSLCVLNEIHGHWVVNSYGIGI